MRKIKANVIALIAVIAAVCCFGLVACANGEIPELGNKPSQDGEYAITWTVGEHAYAAAVGYAELPTKLKSGVEVTFAVVTDPGWEVTAVTPENNVVKQLDGVYKFTVSHDMEIRVLTGKSEEQPPQDDEHSITWTVGEHVAVVAVGYDELPSKLKADAELSFIVTADEGYAAVVSPDTAIKQQDGSYKLVIKGDTVINVSAQKDVVMYELTAFGFKKEIVEKQETIDDYTRKVSIHPFTVSGTFVDAQSAYIKLVEVKNEGVDIENGDVLTGEKVTRSEDDPQFTLEFDYRELVNKYSNVGIGKYVDFAVYVCAEDADGNVVEERIDTANYDKMIFKDLPYRDYYLLRNIQYSLDYYGYFPDLPFQDNSDDTLMYFAVTAQYHENYFYEDANIEIKQTESGNVPVLNITGQYNMSYVRDEALQALGEFVADICPFNEWDNKAEFTQTATLDDKWNFTVSIDLSKLEAGKTYVMHSNIKKTETDKDSNLIFTSYQFDQEYECNGVKYSLVDYETGWGWNWPGIKVVDEHRSFDISKVGLSVIEDKLYYEITFDYHGYTVEEINENIADVFFDLQGNPYMSSDYASWEGDWKRYKGFTVTKSVDEANGKAVIKLDLTTTTGEPAAAILPSADYCYTTHFGFKEVQTESDGIQAPDFKPNIPSFTTAVKFNGKLYILTYTKGGGNNEFYGCVGLKVTAETGKSILSIDPVALEASVEKPYLVITGLYSGYETADEFKSAIVVDCQNPDTGWSRTAFAADKITVTLDAATLTYTVKVDISELAAGQYLFHFPTDSKDIGNENGIDPITCGDKTYSYEFRDFTGWTRYVLTIAAVEL